LLHIEYVPKSGVHLWYDWLLADFRPSSLWARASPDNFYISVPLRFLSPKKEVRRMKISPFFFPNFAKNHYLCTLLIGYSTFANGEVAGARGVTPESWVCEKLK